MEDGAPAEKRFGSRLFWRLFAAINFATVVWVGWVIWQLVPRSVVHDFVLRLPPPVAHRAASGTIPAAPPAALPAVPSAGAPPAGAPAGEIAIQSGAPMTPLKLDTEIRIPPKSAEPVSPDAARKPAPAVR